MEFRNLWVLITIPFVLALVFWLRSRQREGSLRFASNTFLRQVRRTVRERLQSFPFWVRLLALVLMMVALAGPRAVREEIPYTTEGVDIVLAVDASGSMAAEDFKLNGQRVNRLEVVKNVLKDFIVRRPHDRIGLVAFAGRAYTVSPLTTDGQWLQRNLERVDLDLLEDGTAIGSAIMSAVSRLENSEAKSKLIILLTDGVNNAGKISPLEAGEVAATMGIKIYAIGAGTHGPVPYPTQDIWGRQVYRHVRIDLDEETLQKIARMTGGQYYRATDTQSLQNIYEEIDQLEQTQIELRGYREYQELFAYVLAAALALIVVEQLLSSFFLVRIP